MIKSNSHYISDRSIEMSDELDSTLASIHDLMVGMTRLLDQLKSSHHEPLSIAVGPNETVPPTPQTTQVPPPGVSYGAPFQLFGQFETTPPHVTTVFTAPSPTIFNIDNVRLTEQEARMERLEARMR